jgi:hypothetical protein
LVLLNIFIHYSHKDSHMKTLYILLFTVLSTVLIMSCKKDENKEPTTTPKDIHSLIPDSILNKIKTLGMTIHEGTKPPNITRIYLASPFALKATNIPFDSEIGTQFADYHVKFYGQDNSKLTVKMDYLNGPETGTGLGCFISGTDSVFTVAAKISGLHNNADSASLVQVISGIVITGAIKDMHVAFFMLNNYGNISGYWIDNGQGRILYDTDGISEEVDSFKSINTQDEGGYLKSGACRK